MEAPVQEARVCDSCGVDNPKYTCPACETKSCSVDCVKKHKTTKQCSGQIDPTRYLNRQELLTATSLDRDYNFLQGLGRSIQLESHNRQTQSRHPRDGVSKREFVRSGVRIRSMPRAMSRAQKNKSHWDRINRVYMWTVEIIDEDQSRIDNVPESRPVSEFSSTKSVFVRDADNKLQLLSPNMTFGEALRGLTIVEFPVVVLKPREATPPEAAIVEPEQSPQESDEEAPEETSTVAKSDAIELTATVTEPALPETTVSESTTPAQVVPEPTVAQPSIQQTSEIPIESKDETDK